MSSTCLSLGPTLISLAVVLGASPSLAAWSNNVNYGANGGPSMDLYVPDAVDESPGIIVVLHYCSGNSGSTHGWFQGLADQHGFLLIAPDVGAGKNCWDAAPQRSGEREAIVKMVQYVLGEHAGDASRVFAAGASSGACMTNALAAAYPEVFKGGSVLAGVPAGSWTNGNDCCGSNATKSAEEWGNIVRGASPDFVGHRPRMQIFHGTGDTTLPYNPNLEETRKQWTNVLGVSDADATTESGMPKAGWERTSYVNESDEVVLEVVIGQGKPHDLTGENMWSDIVRFFGLDMDTPPDTGTGGMDGAGGDAGTGGMTASAGGAPSGGGDGGTATGGWDGGAASGGIGSDVPNSGGASSGGMNSSGVGGIAPSTGGAVTGGTSAMPPLSTGGVDSSPQDPTGGQDDVGEGSGCAVAWTSSPRGGFLPLLLGGALILMRRRRSS